MKSYKCSKTEVHRLLAKGLRNSTAKVQRKKNKKQTAEIEKKKTKKAKLEAVATMRKT